MAKEIMEIVGKLGVTFSIEFMKDCAIFKFFDKDAMVGKKKVNLVKKADKNLKRIGVAYGMNLPHCFYLGKKYCKNFAERACAYTITPGGLKGCAMIVTFYCKKNLKPT